MSSTNLLSTMLGSLGIHQSPNGDTQMAFPFKGRKTRTFLGRSAYASDMFPNVKGAINANTLMAELARDHRGAIAAVSNNDIGTMLTDHGFGTRKRSGVSGATAEALKAGKMVPVRRRQHTANKSFKMYTTPQAAIRIEREDRAIANELLEWMDDVNFIPALTFVEQHGLEALRSSSEFWHAEDAIGVGNVMDVEDIGQAVAALADVYGMKRVTDVLFTIEDDRDLFNGVPPYAQTAGR